MRKNAAGTLSIDVPTTLARHVFAIARRHGLRRRADVVRVALSELAQKLLRMEERRRGTRVAASATLITRGSDDTRRTRKRRTR